MEHQKKCFSEEHKNINAISFCPECRIYMCNKCENLHSSLFKKHNYFKLNKDIDILFTVFCQEKNHSNKLIKDNEIFTGICKEKNHPMKLEFFCRNHNQLCCVACLCKIKAKGYGAHKDCDVYEMEKIKDEKKNKLKENIKCLEDLENDAIIYCNECMKYFCNKCQNYHSEMFDEHISINLNNSNDIFINI